MALKDFTSNNMDSPSYTDIKKFYDVNLDKKGERMVGDKEEIEDRVISNSRLLELLHGKDDRIYQLERELYDAKDELRAIVRLYQAVASIMTSHEETG